MKKIIVHLIGMFNILLAFELILLGCQPNTGSGGGAGGYSDPTSPTIPTLNPPKHLTTYWAYMDGNGVIFNKDKLVGCSVSIFI